MTENKRFKIVDEQFISYYGGTGHKISNEECGFWLWHNKIESQKVCDKLNSILDENEQLKEEIKDFQDLLANRENELLKPVWDKIYSEFENIVYAEKRAIINLLNECYDEIMKKELQE